MAYGASTLINSYYLDGQDEIIKSLGAQLQFLALYLQCKFYSSILLIFSLGKSKSGNQQNSNLGAASGLAGGNNDDPNKPNKFSTFIGFIKNSLKLNKNKNVSSESGKSIEAIMGEQDSIYKENSGAPQKNTASSAEHKSLSSQNFPQIEESIERNVQIGQDLINNRQELINDFRK